MRSISVLTQCLGIISVLSAFTVAEQPVTREICVTQRTSPSPHGSIPTISYLKTITIPCDVYVTNTPGTTIVPPIVTSTSTITATVTTDSDVPQITDTFTSTSTVNSLSILNLPTTTITVTITTSTTSTTTIAATTIPTPSGFQPVQDTLPNSAAKKKRSVHGRFSPKARSLLARDKQHLMLPPANQKPPPSWPATVICVGVVESFVQTTITKTAHTTTTVKAPTPTTTVSSTTTFTTTDIITTPDASTTVTITQTDVTTATITPSTTSTTTTTLTIVVPSYVAVAYAICASDSDNYVGTLDGYGINAAEPNIPPDNNILLTTTQDTSSEGCCNSCASNPLCAATAFNPNFSAGEQCYNWVSPDTCSFGQYTFEAYYDTGDAPDSEYELSNGNCGDYTQGAEY